MSLSREILLKVGRVILPAILSLPEKATSLVIFSHGSGSSRHSPRNKFVASYLNEAGIATVLADLLTPEEDEVYDNRFDIELLTQRLIAITSAVIDDPQLKHMKLGYFGASTGAASALKAAARLGEEIGAVVSRGGRPDLAMDEVGMVTAPTLLIVGGLDSEVMRLNELSFSKMRAIKRLKVVSGASHLFEEPGKLEKAAQLARDWFLTYLNATTDAVQ
jgi:putative phosphoribosyl transferase